MKNFLKSAAFTVALMVPVAMVPTAIMAQTYHDRDHNDDHQWNNHEDRAYRIYLKQNHRKYSAFATLKLEDQQSYWGWRHEHSDIVLKIK
jgi:hypothetical protein